MKDYDKKGFGTRSVHGKMHDSQFGMLTFPIFASSTTVFDNTKQGGRRFKQEEEGYIYSRLANPSNTYVQDKIASLEGCEAALVFASGMGAISSAILSVVSTGDHIIADTVIYGGTYNLIKCNLARFGIDVTLVDFSVENALEDAIQPNTKLIHIETPANPNLKIQDYEKIVAIAKKHNIMTMADNTVATPYITRPKEYGVDIIVHSATKYLNGHGDITAGAVCGDADFINHCRVSAQKDLTGAMLSVQDAFLLNRGLKTLKPRMKLHCENAMAVAEFLHSHPEVEIVYYPGLKSHENHELAKKQMKNGYSGLLSFKLKKGYEACVQLCDNLEVFSVAVSLGDCESLIQHPASMTHSPYCQEDRIKAGIDDNLLRVSVGLEDVEDLIEDLKTQLDKL